MSEDLRASPIGEHRPHWLYRLHELLTLPFAIHFILSSPKIHPEYKLTAWRRFKLGWRIYRNTHRVWTGISFRAHLCMAVKLFEIPPSASGVVVECGCFRGGTTANLSLICDVVDRELYVYDSFEGLPPPMPGDKYSNSSTAGFLKARLDQVKAHVQAYGKPQRCTYVKGWFKDTTPHHDKSIILMFLDVDYQASLNDCVLNLWPKLNERGYCFIDEYVFLDYCALFWSEKFWSTHFNRTPPGLMGAGSGVSLGGYYHGGAWWEERGKYTLPRSIAFTRKDWSGYWNYYPVDAAPSAHAEDRISKDRAPVAR